MKRTLVVIAAVVGFAAAASAGTLTVVSQNTSNVTTTAFTVGQTIVLKVDGNAQGGTSTYATGVLTYEEALVDYVTHTESAIYPTVGSHGPGVGFAYAFDQINGQANPTAPINQLFSGTMTLVAQAAGVVHVDWRTDTQFFGTYPGNVGATGTTFTIGGVVPEPATAALVGLGLIGLVLGGRRRA